jgi:hypothetical protein
MPSGVEEKRPAKDNGRNKTMQDERASEVAAEVIAALVFVAEFETSGYVTLFTSVSAE